MRELSPTQNAEIDRLATDYASVGVRHLRKGPAVELTVYLEGPDEDGQLDPESILLRKSYGPEGEKGCESCGSISDVVDHGGYGDLCENCYDHILDPI